MNKICFLNVPLLTINILHFYTGQKRKMQKLTKNVTENVKTEIPKITFVVPRFFATEKKEVNDVSTNCLLKNSIGVTNAAITV